MMDICGDVLTTFVVVCPKLGTLTTGVLALPTVVLDTVTSLVPEVVVMVLPVATAFSSFLNFPL